MDFVVKKIQELDVSMYHQKGHYRKLNSLREDCTEDTTVQTTEKDTAHNGCCLCDGQAALSMDSLRRTKKKKICVGDSLGGQSLTDCLKVQPKAIETTPSRPFNTSLSDLLSRIGPSANPVHSPHPPSSRPPAHPLHNPAMPHPSTLRPELYSHTPLDSATSTADPAPPPQRDCQPQVAPSEEVDLLFIRSVTTAELVCGERKYKCSGCLRYYDHLGALLGHIEQGWREGFSCRVFYRKLKSMQERRTLRGSSGKQSRDSSPQPSSAPMTATPTDGQRSHASKDKKAEMIHKWLQKTETTAPLQ